MAAAYGAQHQKRRTAWKTEIKRLGSVQCGCNGSCGHHTSRCRVTIRPGDEWHLGHGMAHVLGGDGTDSTPWCPACNSAEGGRIGRQRTYPKRASRRWG